MLSRIKSFFYNLQKKIKLKLKKKLIHNDNQH